MLTEKLNYPDIIVKSQWYSRPGKTFFTWQEETWANLWAAEDSILGPLAASGLQDPALASSHLTPIHRTREIKAMASEQTLQASPRPPPSSWN